MEAVKWHDKYVFISSENVFFNKETLSLEPTLEFDLRNTKYTIGLDGSTAAGYLARRGLAEFADRIEYRPDVADRVFSEKGEVIVNSYSRPDTVNGSASNLNVAQRREVENRLVTHIGQLCNDEYESEMLLDWLAHQVQNPGVSVPFCPVIIGFPGSGKGYIRALLRTVLGGENVGVVNPSGINDLYNAWAADKVTVIMDELLINGDDRIEVLNRLKPLITNEYVMINEYGEKVRKVKNVTNFLALTNHVDALPLQERDRRYWVIKSRYKSIDEFSKVISGGAEEYFENLYHDVNTQGGVLTEYLLKWEISNVFKSIRRAPMTSAKRDMIDFERKDQRWNNPAAVLELGGNDEIK